VKKKAAKVVLGSFENANVASSGKCVRIVLRSFASEAAFLVHEVHSRDHVLEGFV
jgi:hypothetical protein